MQKNKLIGLFVIFPLSGAMEWNVTRIKLTNKVKFEKINGKYKGLMDPPSILLRILET